MTRLVELSRRIIRQRLLIRDLAAAGRATAGAEILLISMLETLEVVRELAASDAGSQAGA
jgi:hypothetical protein